jgi:hypothetical protein
VQKARRRAGMNSAPGRAFCGRFWNCGAILELFVFFNKKGGRKAAGYSGMLCGGSL